MPKNGYKIIGMNGIAYTMLKQSQNTLFTLRFYNFRGAPPPRP